MRIHIFGLTVSSSWGNGHATLWRGLIRALVAAGHDVTFWERDVPYYAQHRDLHALAGASLRLYADWADVLAARSRAVAAPTFAPDGLYFLGPVYAPHWGLPDRVAGLDWLPQSP